MEQAIESRIVVLRGHRVMLDAELAKLYGVEVRTLNQAVRRNGARFPSDFMFQLTWEEAERSRSQIVILNATFTRGRNIKYRPCAFTEQGVAMLSSVLKSDRAIRAETPHRIRFRRLSSATTPANHCAAGSRGPGA